MRRLFKQLCLVIGLGFVFSGMLFPVMAEVPCAIAKTPGLESSACACCDEAAMTCNHSCAFAHPVAGALTAALALSPRETATPFQDFAPGTFGRDIAPAIPPPRG